VPRPEEPPVGFEKEPMDVHWTNGKPKIEIRIKAFFTRNRSLLCGLR
jgi:hypothetical protein